ncbi:MAG: glycerophosphodiester phosphodiesterase [Rhodocyclaceae bacterium]|nr:glycerophosphodiester phosphodiesterase [Rhodocyclaceae bacterium]
MSGAWPYPRIIAHRGGGAHAPENTLAAIAVAARMGARMVEFDTMLTADGTAVLMHDETLTRTTTATGRIDEYSEADLARIDAGARWHPAFAGEPVPTLAQALELCIRLGLCVNVEIKPVQGADAKTGEVVGQLCAAVRRDRWPAGLPPPLMSSFSEASLAAAARVAPELPRALLCDPVPADWRERARTLGASALHCPAQCEPDRGSLITLIADAGLPVLYYTVNDATLAETLMANGAAGLFTDRLDRLLS